MARRVREKAELATTSAGCVEERPAQDDACMGETPTSSATATEAVTPSVTKATSAVLGWREGRSEGMMHIVVQPSRSPTGRRLPLLRERSGPNLPQYPPPV